MEGDPEYFDAQIAGWWLWGVNAWIGSGWCSGEGPWALHEGALSKRPHLGTAGQGVNRKRPHLGTAGQGVNRQRPHLGTAGQGVNRQRPHLGNSGQAGYNNLATKDRLTDYFYELADRLREVRVCCGDWSRVVTRGALTFGATVGVFLDPPYLGDVRTADLYRVDDDTISHAVREWCLENGDNPRYRIVLAGYSDEHDHLLPDTWRRYYYSASAAYQTTENKGGQNAENRHKEVLWYSPHCRNPEPTLFEAAS
jgi:hypothetical protein